MGRALYVQGQSEIRSRRGDRLCLDPPYRNDLRFCHGQIDFTRFFDWLGRQGGSYVLSLSGRGDGLQEVRVHETLYDERLLGSMCGERPDQVRICDVDPGEVQVSSFPGIVEIWKNGRRSRS